MSEIPLQHRVQPWMMECFGPTISADKQERNHRFLEEALELVQACGATQSEAHELVDYVYGRPVGEPSQEVGGVMITLAALCLANDLNMHQAGEVELARIWTKVEQIRAKQAAKPKHSPLPAAPAQEQWTDEQIVSLLASLGIDATPSIYGFTELQVGTNVPGIRQIIERAAGGAAQLISLQAEGKHPAPCARHCEATSFRIEIRRLNEQLAEALKREATDYSEAVDEIARQAAQLAAPVALCHKCGHSMSVNPHTEAGKPGHYLEVGCPTECIPCTVLSRHTWAERAQKAESDLRELRKQLAAPVAPAYAGLLKEIDQFPELNMNNYTEDQVRELNYWGVRVALAAQEIAAPVAMQEPAGWRDFLVRLSDLEGSMVNGNRLSRAAKDLLAAQPETWKVLPSPARVTGAILHEAFPEIQGEKWPLPAARKAVWERFAERVNTRLAGELKQEAKE